MLEHDHIDYLTHYLQRLIGIFSEAPEFQRFEQECLHILKKTNPKEYIGCKKCGSGKPKSKYLLYKPCQYWQTDGGFWITHLSKDRRSMLTGTMTQECPHEYNKICYIAEESDTMSIYSSEIDHTGFLFQLAGNFYLLPNDDHRVIIELLLVVVKYIKKMMEQVVGVKEPKEELDPIFERFNPNYRYGDTKFKLKFGYKKVEKKMKMYYRIYYKPYPKFKFQEADFEEIEQILKGFHHNYTIPKLNNSFFDTTII